MYTMVVCVLSKLPDKGRESPPAGRVRERLEEIREANCTEISSSHAKGLVGGTFTY